MLTSVYMEARREIKIKNGALRNKINHVSNLYIRKTNIINWDWMIQLRYKIISIGFQKLIDKTVDSK